MTPTTAPSTKNGTANACCSPTSAAAPARGNSGSVVASTSHRAAPDAHTRPGSPMPGGNCCARVDAMNSLPSSRSEYHCWVLRMRPVAGSRTHTVPTSHPSVVHSSSRMPRTASSGAVAVSRMSVTADRTARRRSARTRSVMSSETLTTPTQAPDASVIRESTVCTTIVVPSGRRMR